MSAVSQAKQSTRDQIAEAIYNAKVESKADAYAAADALLAHSALQAPTQAKREEIAGAICEAMDDRIQREGHYPRCPNGSECACWGAADRAIALTALKRTPNLDAARDKILAHWRNRFPTNAYAWPGSPADFAFEAAKAIIADAGFALPALERAPDVQAERDKLCG